MRPSLWSGTFRAEHELLQVPLGDVVEALQLDDAVGGKARHQSREGEARFQSCERRADAVVDPVSEREIADRPPGEDRACSGAANTCGSRFAAPISSSRRDPAGIVTPCRSTSREAIRPMFWTGDSKRRISSIAPAIRLGFESSHLRSARCSASR